jgi:hypothetical protein
VILYLLSQPDGYGVVVQVCREVPKPQLAASGALSNTAKGVVAWELGLDVGLGGQQVKLWVVK